MKDSSKKSSGCTKWAIGCGSALIVLLIILSVGGYFAIKFVGGKIVGASSEYRRLSEIVTLDKEIVNQSPYTPPEDGLMSLEQRDALVRIQSEINDVLGSDQEQIIRDFIELAKETDSAKDIKKLPKLISLSRKLVGPLHRAKKAQIDAINREGISMEEYEWLRTQAMMVFDIPVVQFNLKQLLDQSDEGTDTSSEASRVLTSQPQNRKLLENHEALLRKTLPLSAVGL